MPVLMTLDLPVSPDDLEAVTAEMGVRNDPPDGLIVHLLTEAGGGCHVVDVWESTEQFERFRDARLLPAMSKVAGERNLSLPQDLPPPTMTPARDVVRGR
jgi:hypothetical protein